MTINTATNITPIKTRTMDKREEVLDIASETFLSKGFDGTSINVMAREAGISKESIYRYFGSKEDLFLAVVERELEVYKKGMLDTISQFHGKTLKEALFSVAEATLRVASDDRTLALRRLIFQMSANGSKVGSHYFLAGPDIAYQNLVRLFEHYRPAADLPVTKLSRYFIAMVLHRTMLQRECGVQESLSLEEIRRRSIEAVEDFLQAFCHEQHV
jgi:TetR/AcrR family transcriptional regulator, mexJK operon transcriptional repressor